MHAFAHYLEAKRTVDDRALDRRVLERLGRELETVRNPSIVDVGAGVGIGFERLLEWKIVSDARYTGVERDAALVDRARSRLAEQGSVELVNESLADFAGDASNLARYDLVIAHAFLDVVDLPVALANLVGLARPGGLLYFPITFDGETVFEPAHPDDDAVLSRYHASMDASGSSQTGRRLFHALADEPVEILEMASSDWIVRPEAGSYPNDERFFLDFVLGFVESTVGETAKDWIAARRQQAQDASLLYIAHQLDYLARKHA